MSVLCADADAAPGETRPRRAVALLALCALALITATISLGAGAVAIAPAAIVETVWDMVVGDAAAAASREALVLANIRLPRLLLGAQVGAMLAIAGALMQGLFRNPLADPGLIGVSAGAALAAAAAIVLSDRLFGAALGRLPFAVLPAAAFVGGLLATSTLYLVATRRGRTSVATMLLAGVALGALSGAMTGFLTYLSDDRQLRDLAFWSLGSLAGASWTKVQAVAPLAIALLVAGGFLARGLDALALGEAEAFHLGVPVQRLKIAVVGLTALAVGGSVAAAGLVGFVGIVVPHVLRLAVGPGHALLLPLSALGGATLLMGADALARVVVAPAELPLGVVTAALGAPFFLWMLLRRGGDLE